MRRDKDGWHTFDEDLVQLLARHGWEWLETICPKNPDYNKTKTATWIIKARVKEVEGK